MFRGVAVLLVRGAARVEKAASTQRLTDPSASARSFSDVKDAERPPFDETLLELLVCPLSKKPLR
ncbi:Protein preY, mitochondrial [Liparis tanakae]|uniref:Protein preY, mitochondrial n=1 Tax=Liparis tanakae TaxID=230148 RepID=A0A4Z2EF87_9TELE|nr:Protein preY, mitochondrial [Liparis tanakae]